MKISLKNDSSKNT